MPKHYKTGEKHADSLINKLLKQKHLTRFRMTTELLAVAILDMNLHNLKDVKGLDVVAYETEAMNKLGLITEIAPPPHYLFQSYYRRICSRIL